MTQPLYIAVDLGAGSGRVFLVGLDREELLLQEMRRFQYPPSVSAGHLRWDIYQIFDEIKEGLRAGATRARELGREIQSIGVDSWGVDYGLIDADDNLIELPICYRDSRTEGVMEQLFARVPRAEIFARTGIQFLQINTLFQLFAHAREGIPPKAQTLLLMPDVINFLLCGRRACEYTNATTTQMLSARMGTWDFELLNCLSLPIGLLPEIIPAGSTVGRIRAELAAEVGIYPVAVIAPATHDTGSAVAGAPIDEGWAYISSGTWSLVGVERSEALINDQVARHNFTNEGGAFGTIRFLKNVMGLWILEQCRREWQRNGVEVDYDVLLPEVDAIEDYPALIFPDDQRFLNPPGMLAAIEIQLEETGQASLSEPALIAKTVLDSLAFRYASLLGTIESVTNQKIREVRIIGGGSQNAYLNQATANATGLAVSAGPVEATAIGNALVQSIAAGRFASLTEARRYISWQLSPKKFSPQTPGGLKEASRRYAEVEARYA